MKISAYLVVLCLFLTACEERDYSPERLPKENLEALKYSMVRYFGKLPKRYANHENKFEEQFDDHYQQHAQEHEVLAYYADKAGKEFLLIKREAPSLYKKYVATGIVFERDKKDSVTFYRESFRTWKMPDEELKEKGMLLFDKMVKGEDLSPYYPQNSGDEEFIEFPDDRNAFDVSTRRWLHPSLVSQ
ncbi:hypothetical protein [Pleomorphovibrio marinus]|uniref:hypothetical protein n=1 Tax=Pleomorphovibrio marinus TaxID=2164132 RepID=UPI000E0A6B18|nr:hypothetical protein [Pleomorphovibrio marinus]